MIQKNSINKAIISVNLLSVPKLRCNQEQVTLRCLNELHILIALKVIIPGKSY